MTINIIKLKQDIVLKEKLYGESLEFKSTWGLFSPRGIDEGTLLLLKYLTVEKSDICLDLGCGYGPLGIWMARQASKGYVHLVDKDFVAVDYANKNIENNQINNAKAYLSNALSEISSEVKFDTIVSNVPAKVGRELLSIILHDAKQHLNPGGQIVLVTINGLRIFMKKNLTATFGNYKKLKQGRVYTVARAVFNNE